MKSFLPYLAALAAVFFAVPAVFLALENGAFLLALCMLAVFPAVCFLAYMLYGLRNGFSWIAPLAVGALFAVAALIFFNPSALPYAVAYIVISYIGEATGLVLGREKKRQP